MKLVKEHRIVDRYGVSVIVLSAELFPLSSIRSFHFSYSKGYAESGRGPLRILAVDVLGEIAEVQADR